MYYHFGILLLFRPLIKLRIIGSKVTPKDVCYQAADAIQGLSRSYSQLYTLRRTPSFVPYFVLTSAIIHLAIGAVSTNDSPSETTSKAIEKAAQLDPRVSKSLSQGIADLAEMAPCHHFAEQALNILRYLAKKWNIDVDIKNDSMPPPHDFDTVVKPYTNSLNFFAPNVRENEATSGWGSTKNSAGQEEQSIVQKAGDSIDNPLYWPFPLQGRPILPVGKALEQAGFSLL